MSEAATALTSSQFDFYVLLYEGPPNLKKYWQEDVCLIQELLEAQNFMSHSEKAMADFYLMVWFGNKQYGFDLSEACAVLDEVNRNIIASWVKNPFWP